MMTPTASHALKSDFSSPPDLAPRNRHACSTPSAWARATRLAFMWPSPEQGLLMSYTHWWIRNEDDGNCLIILLEILWYSKLTNKYKFHIRPEPKNIWNCFNEKIRTFLHRHPTNKEQNRLHGLYSIASFNGGWEERGEEKGTKEDGTTHLHLRNHQSCMHWYHYRWPEIMDDSIQWNSRLILSTPALLTHFNFPVMDSK